MKKKAAVIKTRKMTCPACWRTKVYIFDADPYSADVYNDDKKVWLCKECRKDRADDI